MSGTFTVGATLSTTVTTNVPAAEVLLALSVAVHVTVVAPIGKVDPLAGVHAGVIAPSTESFALGENVTVAPLAEVACTVMFSSELRVGAVVSATTTLKVDGLDLLPA